MDSSFFSKKISKSHITEQRFVAYSKAKNYVKHLVSFYDQKKDNQIYDESSILHQIFKEQAPVNSLHKLSLMPKASVSSEVEEKIKLLNAFHNLSEKKAKKSLYREKKSSSLSRKARDTYFTTKKYKSLLNKLNNDTDSSEKHENATFVTTEPKYLKQFSEILTGKQRTHSQNKVFPLLRDEQNSNCALSKHGSPKLVCLDYSFEQNLTEGCVSNTSRFPRLKTLKSKKKRIERKEGDFGFRAKKIESGSSKYFMVPNTEYLVSSLKDAEMNT